MIPGRWMGRRGAAPARGLLGLAVLAIALLQGCATTAAPTTAASGASEAAAPARAPHPTDPWENLNRKVFSFNEGLDEAVLKPVAIGYTKVVPQLVRTGVTNFFGNFSDAWSAVNNLLQGKGEQGLNSMMRVGTNTVFGILGVFDVATEAGIERHTEDFGQTLGVWGLPPGPYLVLPLLGPSNVRDASALPLDMAVGPTGALNDSGAQFGVTVLGVINGRANLLSTTNVLDDIALDRYTFVRDAYLQRRRSLVYDGEPPELPDSADPVEPPPDDKP
ncbi:MAG: VacJ family lipoprotein [Pseudomonadota bacterium]